MFGNFVIAVATIADYLLEIYMWIIIIASIMSWVNPDPHNKIVRFLRGATEPVLSPIRKVIGYRLGPIDISPLVAIIAIVFVQKFLIKSLFEFGMKLKGGMMP